ncbi:hypothetical protein AB0230_01950 [Microbacterium sp. NPDC089190]|uniref:hypothetical protein n=1 Tax=Microbacterium sp. NPDC089190 TaxID=3155063 RepID=UPI00344D3C50
MTFIESAHAAAKTELTLLDQGVTPGCDTTEALRDLADAVQSLDWRVLGGVIPGPIPAEWARQGDTIRDNGVTGTITRIVNTGRMVHLYINSGHVCFAKVTRHDWVRVISAGETQ